PCAPACTHLAALTPAPHRGAGPGTVAAVSAAGDHDLLRVRRIVRDLSGDVIAVTRRCPRPGDRHPRLLPDCEERGRPLRPQHIRGTITQRVHRDRPIDRKSTRLNSSHVKMSYAACYLKKHM